jgi:hypothetical protein
MIIVRFMEVSLGYARMQVNTLRRVSDDKGLERPLLTMGGYDLRQAMEYRPEKLNTIARQ